MLNLKQIIEALIFASDIPLPVKKIKEITEEDSEKAVREILLLMQKEYEKKKSPLELVEVAGGFQLVTRPEYAGWIKKLYRSRAASHLTQKALETLAIIAYKQPLTKQEVEAIRGVNSDAVIKTLLERNLITISGRLKAPGNPLIYKTTKYFLEYFGLKSIKDLPKLKEIDELLKSDDKFLESLDRVSLEQLNPEELGLQSMLKSETSASAAKRSGQTQEESTENLKHATKGADNETE